MEDTSESMDVEPGEIVEKPLSDQNDDDVDDDVVSLYVGEDARHSFSDEENQTQLSIQPLDYIHRDPENTETNPLKPSRDNRYDKPLRTEDRKKNFYNNRGGRNSREAWKFSRFESNDRFRLPPHFRNWRRNPIGRRRPLWKSRRLCRPIVFCSTDEGYTLTNGARWHTSEFVSPGFSWIEDVLDAIRYLTDNACCDSENEQGLIVYVPDDFSWRRMNEVIFQCKSYWTCTISLRKVKMCGHIRWLPHHRDMAERVLKNLT